MHVKGGSYEDYYDYIIASYMSKEKVEDSWSKLTQEKQVKIDKYNKCQNCLIHELDKEEDYIKNKHKINEYCQESNIVTLDTENYIYCKNEYYDYYCFEDSYSIEEVEVIE